MSHYYEKNIVEIKNEYTEFLLHILTPLIYEGIKSIYDKAMLLEEQFKNNNNQNLSIFKIFQMCLRDIPNLNNISIENEVLRIKERSRCSEWFDNLVRSVIKSYIILLTFNKSQQSEIVKEKHHETVNINLFIHKCYIECSKLFFNYPELFWHKFSILDIKRNKEEIYKLIHEGIKEAIRQTLPMKLMLDEYLKNDFINEENEHDKYKNIKNMIDEEEYYEHRERVPMTTHNYRENITSTNIDNILNSDENNEIEEEFVQLDNLMKESEQVVLDKLEIQESDKPPAEPKIINLVSNGGRRNEMNFFKDEINKYQEDKLNEDKKENPEKPDIFMKQNKN